MRAFKFLDATGCAPFTAITWPDAGTWIETSVARSCHEGVHACRPADLAHWLGASLWEVELGGDVVTARHKLVATRGRLVREVDGYPSAVRALADVGAWRARDRAVDAARASGEGVMVELLEAASTLEELAAVGAAIDESTHVGRAAALAADAAHFAMHGEPAQSPFVAACSAGHAAAGTVDDQQRYDAGYADERDFQSAWLTDRLALTD